MGLTKDELGRIINTHLQPVVQVIASRKVLEDGLVKAEQGLADAQKLVVEIKTDLAEYDKLTAEPSSEPENKPADDSQVEVAS